eukprot:1142381-Pelagomonas_calceolata.AAC.6
MPYVRDNGNNESCLSLTTTSAKARHKGYALDTMQHRCAHSQPLHLIGTILALKCSWRSKLPEHMLRFAEVALCAKNRQS